MREIGGGGGTLNSVVAKDYVQLLPSPEMKRPKRGYLGGQDDIKSNCQLNQSKPQKHEAMAQDNEPATKKKKKPVEKKKTTASFSACAGCIGSLCVA